MGILQRVVAMTKAMANEVLDKMENPAMMMNHYVRELEEELERVEQARFQQQTQARALHGKLEELNRQAAYYESKAEQAAAEGREAEARIALEAKLLYLEQAEETARLKQLAEQAVASLEQRTEWLKEEKIRLWNKRTELQSRAKKAEATSAGSGWSAATGLGGSEASRGFERIEGKIMELEAARELSQSAPADLKHEQRSALVEEELQRLLEKQAR